MANSKERPPVPHVSSNSRVAELRARIESVQSQQRAAREEVERLQGQLAAQGTMGPIKERALAFVASGASDFAEFEANSDANHAALKQQLKAAAERLEALAGADVELQKQLEQAVRVFSAAVSREQMPRYEGGALREIALRLVALSEAIEAEIAIRDDFEAKGLSTGYLLPAPFTGIGRLRDPNSRVSMYLAEMKKRGVISDEEVQKFTGRGNSR